MRPIVVGHLLRSSPPLSLTPTRTHAPRQAAQQLLLSAVRGAVAERCFEASVYHNMAAAAAALEQVNAADVHLRGLQALISAHRRRDELARAAHAAAAADGGGGGGGDALMLDGDGGGLGV